MRGSLKHSYVIAMEEAIQMKDVPCEVRLQMCHFRPTNVSRPPVTPAAGYFMYHFDYKKDLF